MDEVPRLHQRAITVRRASSFLPPGWMDEGQRLRAAVASAGSGPVLPGDKSGASPAVCVDGAGPKTPSWCALATDFPLPSPPRRGLVRTTPARAKPAFAGTLHYGADCAPSRPSRQPARRFVRSPGAGHENSRAGHPLGCSVDPWPVPAGRLQVPVSMVSSRCRWRSAPRSSWAWSRPSRARNRTRTRDQCGRPCPGSSPRPRP